MTQRDAGRTATPGDRMSGGRGKTGRADPREAQWPAAPSRRDHAATQGEDRRCGATTQGGRALLRGSDPTTRLGPRARLWRSQESLQAGRTHRSPLP